MDTDKLQSHMQYVERNGVCLNIEEKMRLGIAFQELKNDLGLTTVFFVGKISGK